MKGPYFTTEAAGIRGYRFYESYLHSAKGQWMVVPPSIVYIPPIYLSILSHSVLPVDRRYLICPCNVLKLYHQSKLLQHAHHNVLTRSVTPRCRSNSARTWLRVSSRVAGSEMRLVPRMMIRYRARARDRWRKWSRLNVAPRRLVRRGWSLVA